MYADDATIIHPDDVTIVRDRTGRTIGYIVSDKAPTPLSDEDDTTLTPRAGS